MIKKNSNGEFVITKGALAIIGTTLTVIALAFSFFTYTIGRVTESTRQYTRLEEVVKVLQEKSEKTDKFLESISKDLQNIREDLVLIKVKLGLIDKGR
jgi:riboflavin synthase alpha subunit